MKRMSLLVVLSLLCVVACGDDDAADASVDVEVEDTRQSPDADPEEDADVDDASAEDAEPTEDADVPDQSLPDATVSDGFREVDGIVSIEAEHYTSQDNTEDFMTEWYTFEAGEPDPNVSCVTNTVCTSGNRPMCNQYGNCDGDDIDPADASNNAYVEALPDRRRDDSEAQTGNLGVTDQPQRGPILHYSVNFTTPGRYYAWARARGQGPAANGLHIGIDGDWPDNTTVNNENSGMRWQFRNGWEWTQNRRGARTHTGGVSGGRDSNVWIEVSTAGVHDVTIGMREDGLEFDKLVLARDAGFEPQGDGPAETR